MFELRQKIETKGLENPDEPGIIPVNSWDILIHTFKRFKLAEKNKRKLTNEGYIGLYIKNSDTGQEYHEDVHF